MQGAQAFTHWLAEWLTKTDGGDRLPSQAELCGRFRISKRVVKGIIDQQVLAGALVARPRSGVWRVTGSAPPTTTEPQTARYSRLDLISQIEAALLAQEWPRDEPLPTIRWLAQRFGRSASTCTDALDELQRRKVISKRGRRWYRTQPIAERLVLLIEPRRREWTRELVPLLEAQLSLSGYAIQTCAADTATASYADILQHTGMRPHVLDISCAPSLRDWIHHLCERHGRGTEQPALLQVGQQANVVDEVLHCRRGSFRTSRARAVRDFVLNRNCRSITLLATWEQSSYQVEHIIACALETTQSSPETTIHMIIRTDHGDDVRALLAGDDDLAARYRMLLKKYDSWTEADLFAAINLVTSDAETVIAADTDLIVVAESLATPLPDYNGYLLALRDSDWTRASNVSALSPNLVYFSGLLVRALTEPNCLPLGQTGRIRPPVTIIHRRSTVMI